MRDCHAHDVEQVPFNAINPCEVFWHEDSNMWYHMLTGDVVRMHLTGDGTMFDVQEWLLVQAGKAMEVWSSKTKVHETYIRGRLTHKPSRPAAIAPKHTAAELDVIASNFIRTRGSRRDTVDEIQEIGEEIRGYARMQRKWKNNAMLSNRLKELRERREALSSVQSDMDKDSGDARSYLKEENGWTKRWTLDKTNWKDFVLVWQDPKTRSIWSIDRHGLKLNEHYFYLPERDRALTECVDHAKKEFGIPTEAWKKMEILGEKIGSPLRRHGKKNANGSRIAARFDQKKYAETCIVMVKQMKALGIKVNDICKDKELFQYYLDNIAPKLQSR